MKKAIGARSKKYYLFWPLGKRIRRSILTWYIGRKCSRSLVQMPVEQKSIRKILCIMPENVLDALQQVGTVVSIVSHFDNAEINLLCEVRVSPFFQKMYRVSGVFEYTSNECYEFSEKIEELGFLIKQEEYDLCVMLDKRPPFAVAYLGGLSRAPIRICYSHAAAYPYCNVRITPDESNTYLPTRNLSLAKHLGAPPRMNNKWIVSKEALEEIEHLLREAQIPADAALVGIDACEFYHRHGKQWLELLCSSINENTSLVPYVYLHAFDAVDVFNWAGTTKIAAFSHLKVSRWAALIHCSKHIVSGRSPFFELANLLHKSVIGIFEQSEIDSNFCKFPHTQVVSYQDAANESTVRNILDSLSSLK
ncbi:MAG: hypothetical protein GF398_11975 [Chitinivibrionales bacterium]|nr:hypothetical protein [Chitinivibrionales bacterium]